MAHFQYSLLSFFSFEVIAEVKSGEFTSKNILEK